MADSDEKVERAKVASNNMKVSEGAGYGNFINNKEELTVDQVQAGQ